MTPIAANLDWPWAPCVVFPAIALIAVTVSVASFWLRRRSFQKMLDRLARQLNGTAIASRNFSCYGSLEFEHRGFSAKLRFSEQHSRTIYTSLEIRWAGPRFRCEIYPESVLTRVKKLFGMQDILIGAPLFDETFLISGDRPAEIAAFLTPHVQYAIFDLADPERVGIQQSKTIHIAISPDSLRVTRNSLIDNPSKVLEFIRQCLELFELAASTREWGIEFLDSSGSSTASHCMVCGETLAGEVVYCLACKTPHHRDCWSYGGGCSTYGCGEKRFAVKA
jgi:hypothetical protein